MNTTVAESSSGTSHSSGGRFRARIRLSRKRVRRFLFPQPSSPTAASHYTIQSTTRILGTAIPGNTTTAGNQVPATLMVPTLDMETAALPVTGIQTTGTSSMCNSATTVGQASASPTGTPVTGHPTHLTGAILMSPRYDNVGI